MKFINPLFKVFLIQLILLQTAFAEAPEIFNDPEGAKKIFLVQDVLLQTDDQLALSASVRKLIKEQKIKTLFTAGGSGDISLPGASLSSVSSEKKGEAGDALLRAGLLTTAEHVQLHFGEEVKLRGIEVSVLYEKAVLLYTRIFKRSSSFFRFKDELLAADETSDKESFERIKRVLDFKILEDDEHRFEEKPDDFSLKKIRPDADRRLTYRFSQAVKTLIDLNKILSTREVFMMENLYREMEETGEKKAVLFLSGKNLELVKKFLQERKVSYETIRPTAPSLLDEASYEKRLGQEQLLIKPQAYGSNAWKKSWISREPLEFRPLREKLVIDILNDRRPALWELGEKLGLSPSDNLQYLFNCLGPSSVDVLKRHDITPKFSWAGDTAPDAKAQLGASSEFIRLWSERAMKNIERDYNRERYVAFKLMADKMSKTAPDGKAQKIGALETYIRSYEAALESAEQAKAKRKEEFLGSPFITYWFQWFRYWAEGFIYKYQKKEEETTRLLQFIRSNRTPSGMPLSYKTPKEYWLTAESPMDAVDSVLERLNVEYSVSIYDAALWQIALAIVGNESDQRLVDDYTARLISGSSGELNDIRAYGETFRYGDQKKIMDRDNGFFFRIIADQYLMTDPLDGTVSLPDFPNFPMLHHEDWKPITGEQAWAAIIGPLQRAYEKYNGQIPPNCVEMKLALSIFPALEAMMSPIGGFYHVPDGTHGKSPHDISNENNCSMYAALGILEQALGDSRPDVRAKIRGFMEKQRSYFKNYGFEKEGIFNQGGFYFENTFVPARILAVDCQTWAINALGPKWIDETFGEGASYRIWQITKDRAGHFDEKGVLRGVGFTDGHDLHSVEWTCGAVLSVKLMADYYKDKKPDWARLLRREAISMRQGMDEFRTNMPDGSLAYYYANKRYFIPWGWWANPIPSLASSAWIVLIDKKYNPFILGGGPEYRRASK